MRRLLGGAGLAWLWGCRGDAPAPAAPLPSAEFLFAAGDSTYWIRSSSEGMRVRSAPILLTAVDQSLHEVFISDDGAEFADASFRSERLWGRSLTAPDSVLLFADSTVSRELAAWRRRHPREMEIDPADEDAPADPRTVVQEELDLLDVHGPYLTFEHLLNVDLDGATPHQHAGHRYVVDVRTGHRPTIADLLGAGEAVRVITAARASLRQLTDSIRRAGATGETRATAAVETLDSFRFDSTSFGLTDVTGRLAIGFMVPGRSSAGEALALNLPPIVVVPPRWWTPVASTLPAWTADSSQVQWTRDGYAVVARPSADEESLALVLVDRGARRRGREWPIATVGAPAYQLIPLEAPPLDSTSRAALARAFDLSAAHDGLLPQAQRHGPRAPMARLVDHRFSR